MDDIIKSAREIALEKVEKLGQATEEERLSWKYQPLGETLAHKYLTDDRNLVAELSQYQDNVKKHVVRGATEVLIRNIDLPKNEAAKKKTKKTMDGLKLLKSDKVGVENVYSKLRYLFNHYEEQGGEQRQRAFQSLKADMQAKLQKALQQQVGAMITGEIDVEKQPQFQQEWRKLQAQLDSAYLLHLNEYKHELAAIR